MPKTTKARTAETSGSRPATKDSAKKEARPVPIKPERRPSRPGKKKDRRRHNALSDSDFSSSSSSNSEDSSSSSSDSSSEETRPSMGWRSLCQEMALRFGSTSPM
ncbi:hypothetical protein F441_11700 [Phytophthora nicotianae CJ01A1]|uniref:Uncharacterized protein n=1 Tax=Phytophthora nicotianae CJ01A1 TaxID=1317063 RepID=W2WR39_PHYNI|nr:hypothetical protein F441_11700 [Phytophthora nicotianae CJ01A1]